MRFFFEVCFYVGSILTILFFLLGHVFDFLGFDGGGDGIDIQVDSLDIDGIDIDGVDLDGMDMDGLDTTVELSAEGAPMTAGHGFSLLPWLKPNLILLFLTIMGGSGLILQNNGFSFFISLVVAVAIGLIGVIALNKLLIIPLKKQSTNAVSQNDLIGKIAKAGLSITKDNVGFIVYTVEGNTYQAPAKAYDDVTIRKGDDVVIIEIKNNLFYVNKF